MTLLSPEVISIPAQSERGKAEELVRQMELDREPLMPLFHDLQEFVAPFTSNVDNDDRTFQSEAYSILDETILYAKSTLASFFSSAMTNPSRAWRVWKISDPDLSESQAVKEWEYTTNDRAMTILSRSNFYDTMAWVYEEWPTFATAVVMIEEDERDVFRYVPLPIGS